MGQLYQMEPSSVEVYNCFLSGAARLIYMVLLLEHHLWLELLAGKAYTHAEIQKRNFLFKCTRWSKIL